ncbi:MAG: tRNA preQ1(34) S-adenosylmethionine ribosyltransferase-isomerase QueA [Gammaproteobacteria bacterium]|nr:tRNA preQ1(34) S-adenosylmethionine ribosyltransferase-isomerase QueA [Gammaproteobacteria bacterium]
MRAVQASDFDFELPAELIAQRPLPQRSASRLLVVDPRAAAEPGRHVDAGIGDLERLLEPGDLLVFNDTRVIPARLHGRKPSGGAVEMLLERPLAGCEALLHMRASKPLRAGQLVHTPGGTLVVEGREQDLFRVRLPQPAVEFFVAYGEVPLPPYIERSPEADDLERYQSVLARVPGAVAAPTASLHFDQPLLEALAARGVQRTTLTLHVGAGTFQPLRSERIEDHVMHAEWAEVPAAACAAIAAAQAAGRRVIAVGTTVVRALESAALAASARGGPLAPWTGETRIFITPGFHWRVVDALVTNFHLPRSTLLMLVSAFVGRETILAAYAHAVAQRYRFFSYGDAMFLAARTP